MKYEFSAADLNMTATQFSRFKNCFRRIRPLNVISMTEDQIIIKVDEFDYSTEAILDAEIDAAKEEE